MGKHLPEIGSDFWEQNDLGVKENESWKKYIDKEKVITTFESGRNAIWAFCKEMQTKPYIMQKSVLLPEYTCESVIEPFLKEGWTCYFYPVKKDFTIDWAICRQRIESYKPEVVYLQSYFGFSTLNKEIEEILEWCRKRKIVTIEDITHSIFNVQRWTSADWHVASLRKWMAVSDGGILIGSELKHVTEEAADDTVVELAQKAFAKKKQYIEGTQQDFVWKQQYQAMYKEWKQKSEANNQIREMSKTAMHRWQFVQKEKMILQRQENYQQLYEYLKNREEFQLPCGNLTKDDVPMYLPVYARTEEERNKWQQLLGDKQIYCPIIWPYSELVTELSEEGAYIYRHILCIPIDQRYDERDMQYIVETLEELE